MTKLGKILTVSAVISMGVSSSVSAACWTPAEADAAIVRNLQTRLMVAALRCGRSEHNLLNDYNRFVKSQKPLLRAGNKVLRQHFAKGRTQKQALRSYDRYTVSLANNHGAGSGDLSECKKLRKITQSAASSGNRASLLALANDHDLKPRLPGGQCRIVIASKK